MLAYYAPDAVVVDQRPHGLGSFSGHDELRNYYLSIFHSVDAMREHLEVLAHQDGTVVAHCELWAAAAPGELGARLPAARGAAASPALSGLGSRIDGGGIAGGGVYPGDR